MSAALLCTDKSGALTPGAISEEMFDILIDISAIRSKKVICALKGFFVDGRTRADVCEAYDVNPGYLSTKIKSLLSLVNKVLSFYLYYNDSIKMDIKI